MSLGIVFQRRKTSTSFYPTRLATALMQAQGAMGSVVESSTDTMVRQMAHSDSDSIAGQDGFLVIETNYRLYAYTRTFEKYFYFHPYI